MLLSLLDGVVSSSPVVCLALVYGILYGVLGLMDLTVPARFAAAGYAACLLADRVYPMTNPVEKPLLLAVAVVGCVAVTLPIWLLLRPLTTAAPLVILVGSLGLVSLLQAIFQAAFGASPLIFSGYPAESGFAMLGTTATPLQMVFLGYALFMAICIALILYGTNTGKQLRALSEDSEVAICVFGINAKQLTFRAVLISSVLLAPAGFLYAVGQGVSPSTGNAIGLTAFVATIVAGRRRPLAAAGVALAIALVGTAAIRWNLSEALGALVVFAVGSRVWPSLKPGGRRRSVALGSLITVAALITIGPAAGAIRSVLPVQFGSAQLPSDFQPIVPYAAVVAALLWRPSGIFTLKTRLV